MHIAYMYSGTGLRVELQIPPFVESYDVTGYFQNKNNKTRISLKPRAILSK